MDVFTSLSGWHWLAIAALCLALEIAAPSAFFLWPAIAAAIVAVIVFLAPSTAALLQVLVFAILAVIAIVAWRALPWRQTSVATQVHLNRRAEQYLGRRASVAEAFENGRGAVEIDDTRWSAQAEGGEDLPSGAHVEIIAVDGTLLRVKPV